MTIEGRIRKEKARAASFRKSFGPNEPRKSREAAAKTKRLIQRSEDAVDDLQRIWRILHEVGDALAFSLIDGWDIKAVAFRPNPGFILGKAGFRAELACARSLWAQGHFAILNDTTTCLRFGASLGVGTERSR